MAHSFLSDRQQVINGLLKSHEEFRRLFRNHEEFENRLAEIDSHPFMTADEEMERKRIKKMKLKEFKEIIAREDLRLEVSVSKKVADGELDYDYANDSYGSHLWPRIEKSVWEEYGVMLNYQEEVLQ